MLPELESRITRLSLMYDAYEAELKVTAHALVSVPPTPKRLQTTLSHRHQVMARGHSRRDPQVASLVKLAVLRGGRQVLEDYRIGDMQPVHQIARHLLANLDRLEMRSVSQLRSVFRGVSLQALAKSAADNDTSGAGTALATTLQRPVSVMVFPLQQYASTLLRNVTERAFQHGLLLAQRVDA